MQIRILKAIQNAVQSITDCTSPVIEVGGVLAKADGLRSPYVSHRNVSWEVVETRPGEMIASSPRYSLAIQTIYAPEDPPEADVVGGFVGTWQGGYVPTHIVRPVLDLAESLGLHLDGDDAALVRAYVPAPKLAGFHLGRPVFWLADQDNDPLDITAYVDDPVAEVGGVSLVHLVPSRWNHRVLSLIPVWWNETRIGTVARDEEGRVDDVRRADIAHTVSAMYRGEPVYLVDVEGPATLVAESGERLNVDGRCLAIMPASQKALERV